MEELTEEEIKIFDGMNEVNIEMDKKIEQSAPRCHMKPMMFEGGDFWEGTDAYWECETCGHTKDVI